MPHALFIKHVMTQSPSKQQDILGKSVEGLGAADRMKLVAKVYAAMPQNEKQVRNSPIVFFVPAVINDFPPHLRNTYPSTKLLKKPTVQRKPPTTPVTISPNSARTSTKRLKPL